MERPWQRPGLQWTVILVLYAACWVLPIFKQHIGFDGARLAHEEFWRLLSGERELASLKGIVTSAFIAVGWSANEAFIVGLAAYRSRPDVALRAFALAFGVMVSWQVAMFGEFPLRIGYWAWVIAGFLALGVAARCVARDRGSSPRQALRDPVVLLLLVVPNLFAIAGNIVEAMEKG